MSLDVVVDGGKGGVGSGLGGLEGGLEGDLGGRNLSSVLQGQSSHGTSQQLKRIESWSSVQSQGGTFLLNLGGPNRNT